MRLGTPKSSTGIEKYWHHGPTKSMVDVSLVTVEGSNSHLMVPVGIIQRVPDMFQYFAYYVLREVTGADHGK